MKRYIVILIAFILASISCLQMSFAGEDWENLFDGKTLNGWIQRNGKAKYTVEDGMIVGTTVLNTPNSFLCTEKDYTDFILELEFLVETGMNSGIQIRSNSFKHYKDYRVHGYQVEIDTSDRAWSAGIYDEARRGWLFNLKDKPEAQKAFKQNQWNYYRIEAIGDRIRTWINGVPAADLKDDMTSTGFIALQVHGSKHADKKIKWRNIRIQDLTRKENKGPLKALIVDGQNNHSGKGTPTADKVSLRAILSAPYDAIREYDFGKSRRALAAIEEEIRNVPPSSFPQIEAELLDELKSSKTTFAGKQFICRMLRRAGSAKSVPALSKMLADKELSHIARFALQYMAAPEAGATLREALTKLDGDLKIGVIGSIGQRGDREAVPAIAGLVAGSKPDIARAAIESLGRIGGSQAAETLERAEVPASLKPARDNAYLMCADKMLGEGQVSEAVNIYRKMIAPANSTWIRIAAYKGLVRAEKDKAIPLILALLKDRDLDLQRAAGKFITEMPGTAITKALAEQLGELNPDAQVVLLSALEGRGDKAAALDVARVLNSRNETVRLAAIKALAVLGGASNVELLADMSAADHETDKAAMDTLGRLSGPGVAAALIGVAQSRAETSVRINVIETLTNRRETEAIDVLLVLAKDSNRDIRQAAYKALGVLSDQKYLPAMVSMLLTAKSNADRSGIERALIAAVARLKSPDAQPLINGLAKANRAAKPHLLAVLSRIGGPKALDAVRRQVLSEDNQVKTAAIRALADWPDAAPLSDLMKIAKTDRDSTCRVLALRGYIKLLGIPANRGAAETVKLLSEAMDIAKRAEEKKAVLSALPKYPCEEALALAENAKKNRDLAAEAELASKKIREALLNKSLKATASRNNNAANRALDGELSSRWDTGRAMKPGDWFVLDLGVESTIKGLTLDTRNSSNDYPRGYEVYVSFDGGSWGKPVVTGKGTKPITEIKFGKPVRTRFIKILQTGSSDSWHWSIHELKIDL